jgi:hypothetical protein
MKNRDALENNLMTVFGDLKKNRKLVDKLKKELDKKYNIYGGDTQSYIQGSTPLDEIDARVLCLLTLEAFEITKNDLIAPEKYFTPNEIKESKTYEEVVENEKIDFPITLNEVIQVDVDDYVTKMSIIDIKKWMDNNLLTYNFDTQRNAKLVRKGDKIIETPNVNPKSVKEIAEHILNGTLKSTTITFNVRNGSSDSGDDIHYDVKSKSLTILKGSIVDILDGFHRISGALQALTINPEIEFTFKVSINNYNLRDAQDLVGQVNTVNPMDAGHLKAIKQARKSDLIVRRLGVESELKGRISRTSKVTTSVGHIVSSNTLADTIDEVYSISNKIESDEVFDYLKDFFDYLISYYPNEFNNPSKDNLMSHNVMFAGYIALSKLFKDQGIRVSKIKSVLDSIDFSRNNPLWRELGVLDEKETVTGKARTKIKDYFSKLDMKVVA